MNRPVYIGATEAMPGEDGGLLYQIVRMKTDPKHRPAPFISFVIVRLQDCDYNRGTKTTYPNRSLI